MGARFPLVQSTHVVFTNHTCNAHRCHCRGERGNGSEVCGNSTIPVKVQTNIRKRYHMQTNWFTSYLIRALIPYHRHLLLLLNHVVIVVKLCCVEGLMEDR